MFDVGRSFFVIKQLSGKSTLKPDDPENRDPGLAFRRQPLLDSASAGMTEEKQAVWLYITPAVKYPTVVIPAEAGIQKDTGYRIQSGVTELAI